MGTSVEDGWRESSRTLRRAPVHHGWSRTSLPEESANAFDRIAIPTPALTASNVEHIIPSPPWPSVAPVEAAVSVSESSPLPPN